MQYRAWLGDKSQYYNERGLKFFLNYSYSMIWFVDYLENINPTAGFSGFLKDCISCFERIWKMLFEILVKKFDRWSKIATFFNFADYLRQKRIFGNILHDHWVFATLLVFWFKILLQNADFGTNLALATLDYLMVHKFAMIQNVNVGVACNSRILFCQSSFYLGTNVLHKWWIQLSLPYKKLKVFAHCVIGYLCSKIFFKFKLN